jgi:hypothetical protein
MSHDHRLDPAIDQLSRLADDVSYPTCTACDNEGSAAQSWSDDVAYMELHPGFTGVPWPTVTAASTYASEDSSLSCQGHLSHSARANNLETSGPIQQFTSNVEFLDPLDIYSLNNQDAEHWPGDALDPALQAMSPSFSTSWELDCHDYHESGQLNALAKQVALSSFDIHQLTHVVSSNQHATQAPSQQHLDLLHVGMPFGQSYAESKDMSRVLMKPGSNERLDDFEDFESFDGARLLAGDASSLHRMPSTTSESSGLQSGMSARSTESEVVACTSCTTVFQGVYARGNYRRHRRQKHVEHRLEYVCKVSSCSKHFKRGDARLKHYRRHHPHLTNEPKFRNDRDTGHYRESTSDGTQNEDQDHLSSITLPPRTSGDSQTLYTDTTPFTTRVVAERLSIELLSKDGEGSRCDICQKGFNRAAELRRHKSSVHNLNSQQYFCTVPGCDRVSRPFRRKDKLADHTTRVHNLAAAPEAFENDEEISEATYRCEYQGCEREFDQRAELLRHKRTHTCKHERPYKCAQCRQSFLYPKDLKRHQATHLDVGDMPMFHCEVASCEYGPGRQGFSRKDGMVRHMRRFHPELYVV